jgi:hypothetical protein
MGDKPSEGQRNMSRLVVEIVEFIFHPARGRQRDPIVDLSTNQPDELAFACKRDSS